MTEKTSPQPSVRLADIHSDLWDRLRNENINDEWVNAAGRKLPAGPGHTNTAVRRTLLAVEIGDFSESGFNAIRSVQVGVYAMGEPGGASIKIPKVVTVHKFEAADAPRGEQHRSGGYPDIYQIADQDTVRVDLVGIAAAAGALLHAEVAVTPA